MIVRRGVAYAGSIPELNFSGPESFVPVSRLITTNNLAGDISSAQVSFVTENGSSAPYLERPGGPFAVSYAGVPDSLLRAGELHALEVVAAPANGTSARVAILLHRSAVNDTVAFGPALNQPAVTSLGSSPYLRLRAQLAAQAAYNGAANADFSQNTNSVGVTTTAGYSGNTPVNWSLDIPDLTSAGYDPAWGLRSGSPVDWEVAAVGGSVLALFGATPVDGGRVLGAVAGSSSSAVVGNTVSAAGRFRRFKLR
jgi:hypothetical protein